MPNSVSGNGAKHGAEKIAVFCNNHANFKVWNTLKNECWVLHAQGRALQVNQNISWSTKMANKGSVSWLYIAHRYKFGVS